MFVFFFFFFLLLFYVCDWSAFFFIVVWGFFFFFKSIFSSFKYLRRTIVPARNPCIRKDQNLACL